MVYKLLLVFVGIGMIVVGYLDMSKSELHFRRSEKWKFKDDSAAPSDEYIDIMRDQGRFKIVVGIIILLLSLALLTDTEYNNNTKNNNDNNSEVSSSFFNNDAFDYDGDGEMDSIFINEYIDEYINSSSY